MRDELVKKYLSKEIRTFNPEIDNKDKLPSAFLEYQGKEFSNANK